MAQLPGVVVVGTGGTIAGTGASAGTQSVYRPAVLGVDALAAAVPDLARIARLSFEQPLQRASFELSPEDWLAIRRCVAQALARGDVHGAVVTHGTDTMEETAFFLHVTTDGDKPVVLTGAMRPATAYSADGPANLYNAVAVAAAPQARGRGAMVVMNERIHGARAVTKLHCASVQAFGSRSAGELGAVADGTPRFFDPPPPRRSRPFVEIPDAATLPRVDIVYGYAGIAPDVVAAVLERGARGLVYAGVGNGNAPAAVREALAAAQRQGVQVVRASRGLEGRIVRNGEHFDDDALGFVTAGELTPQKARVLLVAALAAGIDDPPRLQALFDAV